MQKNILNKEGAKMTIEVYKNYGVLGAEKKNDLYIRK